MNASNFINNLWEMLLTVSLLILYSDTGSCSAHSSAGYTQHGHQIAPQKYLHLIVLNAFIVKNGCISVK
jgi:hypothetical protein